MRLCHSVQCHSVQPLALEADMDQMQEKLLLLSKCYTDFSRAKQIVCSTSALFCKITAAWHGDFNFLQEGTLHFKYICLSMSGVWQYHTLVLSVCWKLYALQGSCSIRKSLTHDRHSVLSQGERQHVPCNQACRLESQSRSHLQKHQACMTALHFKRTMQ